jgi:protein-tyrosine phosphatase
MAEFVMKDMVQKAGLADRFYIASAATSNEEIWGSRGNPVYPPARAKLEEHGLRCDGKRAVRLVKADYDRYDFLIGMDDRNIFNMKRMLGGDPEGKISMLLDYTDHPRSLSDPWYTDDFDSTWIDVNDGCRGLLDYIIRNHM